MIRVLVHTIIINKRLYTARCKRQGISSFKSASGLVKAIIVVKGASRTSRRRVFTGHQDGKIRVWACSSAGMSCGAAPEHRRVGSLPRLRDVLRGSLSRRNYVRICRGRSALWMRHQDAVSCLCVSGDGKLLYSGSWDKTVKVWRLADSRCLEFVTTHDDAFDTVAAYPPGLFLGEGQPLLFTGLADGTVKAWRRDKVDVRDDTRDSEHVLA